MWWTRYRIQELTGLLQLLEYDDKDVAEQLRTIVNYFENFRENCKEVIKTKRKDLKMKFNVQIKSNKRLYDEANIVNHFKVGH